MGLSHQNNKIYGAQMIAKTITIKTRKIGTLNLMDSQTTMSLTEQKAREYKQQK